MEKNFLHKNRAGQVILIALILLGSLGLIGVSVATQMVLEQRKAVLEEKTQKAYYAAESGIEEALKRIKTDGSVSNFNITGVGGADATIQAGEAASGQNFDIGLQLNSGEPFYFNLQGYNSTNNLTVCWDKAGTSFIATLHYASAGNERSYHYAFNTSSSQNPGIVNSGGTVPYDNNGSGSTSCGFTGYEYTLTFPVGATNDYLVIWPLYQNRVRLAFRGNATLQPQGTTITSTGTVTELDGNITRRLKFFQSNRSDYPSSFLQMPVYVRGDIEFGRGDNWNP